MKKLLAYLKDYKKETVLAPLFKMLEASFELLVPLVVAAMIDVGIADGDSPYVVKMGLIMVALGVVGLVCSITAQYFSAKAAVGFATKLRHSLFAHIQGLSFSEVDDIGTSTLITRMTSDINQVQSGVNLVLRLFLRSPFIVFGAMVMAFTIDVKAALIFVVAIPLLSVVVFGIMLISIPLYRKVQERLDKVLGITRENLSGVRVIRAFHREEEERQHFEAANGELTRMQNFVGRISAFMNPVTYVIVNGALIILLYTGAIRVDAGILTQGQVVALVNYMSQILVELVKLANLIITVTKAVACGNRVQSIFEIENSQQASLAGGQAEEVRREAASEPDVLPSVSPQEAGVGGQAEEVRREAGVGGQAEEAQREAADQTVPVVEFQNVSLTYKNAGDKSLSGISFTANPGETIGIIGGTGSGKTSLVHLIPRFYDATEGRVLVDGKDVKDYPISELRRKVGIVLQKAVLFQGTIRENLLWGKEDATEEELREALAVAQAAEVVAGKEEGLDAPVAQGGKNFSGGQKQRLTIARALVRKPEILILDDSASALDYATDARLRKAIREMKDSPVVFVVSQRTSSIRYADKILVLEDGEVVGMGTHDQLLESCEVYREIYDSQYQSGTDGARKHGGGGKDTVAGTVSSSAKTGAEKDTKTGGEADGAKK